MPVRPIPNTVAQEDRLKRDSSFVFQGDTSETIDVEQEITDSTTGLTYDAARLAAVLVMLGERMVGVFLYDYQIEPAFRIIYSMLVADGSEITITYPRQSGKSEVISFTVNVIGILFPVLAKIYPKELGHFSKGVKMGLLAPQLDQVYTVYERCMERLLSPSVQTFLDDPDINDDALSTVNYRLKSGSFLKGQSAAKQSKVESKTYHIIFLDEAQDLDTDKVRRSIIPMAASTFGTIVRTGTPGRVKGDYYYKIKQNREKDRKLRNAKERKTKQLHFEYDYKEVIKQKTAQSKKDGHKFHLLYEKAVMRDLESWGDNSDAFRLAYKVEWLLEVGMFITDRGLNEYVYNRSKGFQKAEIDDFVVAGLDLASAKADTVLTLGKVDEPVGIFGERPRKELLDWVVLSGTNYEEQFQIIADQLLAYQTKVVYVDYTGVGRMFGDLLTYHYSEYMEIVLYTFSTPSKSEMYKRLDEDILNKRISVPANKTVRDTAEFKMFDEQMVNLTKTWKGSIMICEKTPGYKDDMCDSLGLFNLAGNHLYTPPASIEVSENVLINTSKRNAMRRNSSW